VCVARVVGCPLQTVDQRCGLGFIEFIQSPRYGGDALTYLAVDAMASGESQGAASARAVDARVRRKNTHAFRFKAAECLRDLSNLAGCGTAVGKIDFGSHFSLLALNWLPAARD